MYVIVEYRTHNGVRNLAFENFDEIDNFDELHPEALKLRADYEDLGYAVERVFIAEVV